jgi:hypothetical protein
MLPMPPQARMTAKHHHRGRTIFIDMLRGVPVKFRFFRTFNSGVNPAFEYACTQVAAHLLRNAFVSPGQAQIRLQ